MNDGGTGEADAPAGAAPPVPAMVDYAISLEERDKRGGTSLRLRLARLLKRFVTVGPHDLPGFDPGAYLAANPDIATSGVAPHWHYATIGWLEDRPVSAELGTRAYLSAEPRARSRLLDVYASRAARAGRPFVGPARATPRRPGALIVGYVEANLGLAESTRGLARALARHDVPFGIYPYNVAVEDRHIGPFMPERYDRSGRWDVTLFEANGDQIPDFLDQFAHKLQGSHAILRSYWELAEAPAGWAKRLSHFAEIWAPTTFVAQAFRKVFEGPITLVPPNVSVAAERHLPRSAFGLDESAFVFAFTFDYSSIELRKNPLGLLSAFQRAFPDPDERVGLVLKATGASHHGPETRAVLAEAARRDPRITVIDRTLPRDEVLSLIRGCDAYVSLHRSEGFGYGMAEAMALGRPVVATDYSGSADFLSEATGYPVPCRLVPVRAGDYPHGEGQVWAEPDLDAAAASMRRVRQARAEREARAVAGRLLIERRYGEDAVGRIAAERLREVMTGRPA